MLYEKILELQAIELSYWKRGLESNLSTLKEAVKKGIKPVVSFLKFAIQTIENSDRKPGTKDNMLGTVATLKEFRNVIEFTDINYTFLKEFDAFLRNKGLKVNTVGKHMRILRTLVNEAINEGYILQMCIRDSIDRYMQTYAGKESLTHETIHLRQAQVIGSWVKYYWRYFVEWVKGNPICPVSYTHLDVYKRQYIYWSTKMDGCCTP